MLQAVRYQWQEVYRVACKKLARFDILTTWEAGLVPIQAAEITEKP